MHSEMHVDAPKFACKMSHVLIRTTKAYRIQCHHSKRYHSVPGSRGYHLLECTTCCDAND